MLLQYALVAVIIRALLAMSLSLDKGAPLSALGLWREDVVEVTRHVLEWMRVTAALVRGREDDAEERPQSRHRGGYDDEGVLGAGLEEELADVVSRVVGDAVGLEIGGLDDGRGAGAGRVRGHGYDTGK